jgi:fructose-1,6-bisphosphatase I
MRCPEAGQIYSVNHGHFFQYSPGVQQYITLCQQKEKSNGGPYTQRYIGCMVADVHRNLIKGGIFMYPGTKSQPSGKLRLMYECNPFAFIVEVAGGRSSTGNGISVLDVQPTSLHQRVPFFAGSKQMMDELERCL